jgi:hypothetical protein
LAGRAGAGVGGSCGAGGRLIAISGFSLSLGKMDLDEIRMAWKRWAEVVIRTLRAEVGIYALRCFWAGEKSGEALFHDDEFAWNLGMEDRWERNDFEELVAKTFVVRA